MGKYTSYRDHELVRFLQEREDKGAFEELYNRYWDKLLFQALMKLNSEVEAEEVVQDVFLNLWKRRKTIALRNTFYTYIASCVKYEVFARLAQRQKERNFKQDPDYPLIVKVDSTDEWLDYETARQQIEETVSRLPEKCQLVFRLSREEGYSQKDIADKLGISTTPGHTLPAGGQASARQ